MAFSYLRQYEITSGSSTQIASNAQQAQITNLGADPVYLVNKADPDSAAFSAETWYLLAPGETFAYSLPAPASEFVILAQCDAGQSTVLDVFAY